MRLFGRLRQQVRFVIASALASGLVLVGLGMAPSASADSTIQATVTPAEMLARAASWLTANNGKQVPYSQTSTWGGYRQDCSGFVSMTLKLTAPGPNTVGLTNSAYTTPISLSSLRAGDLLIDAQGTNTTRHVVIFEKWANTAHTSYWTYEQRGGHGTDHRIVSYGLNSGSEYKPYRPKNLSAPAPTDMERVSDFGGDGKSDVLGVDGAGYLWYYPNTGNRLGNRVELGHGWGSFKHVMSADWSGDGAADVLGVDAAGYLWYYPHNGNGLGARAKIGNGWSTFKHVMAADWSGDGQADVLGVDKDGKLWYYPHNGNGLSAPAQIGAGWSSFTHVVSADWSGDGKADVIGVDATGNLWYYPHTGSGLGAKVKIGNGWTPFKHVMTSDFSGDGKADVLGVDAAGKLWYYPHNGNGLSAPIQLGQGWTPFTHVM